MAADHIHAPHEHGHASGGHAHGVSANADRRWLIIALSLILGFMAVEVVAGLVAHSLALLSDAAHMLTDAIALILALVAIRLAARPPKGSYTYGLKRAEILSAQVNGLSLLLLAVWLTYEAVQRLLHPPQVAGLLVMVTGLAGIVVNILAAWALSRANRSSLNVEGAFQHIINDLYAFIATTVAGAIVLFTGFVRADSLASLVVVVLMVRAGWGLLRDSSRILLEAAPAGVNPDALAARLLEVPFVVEVHDLHVWVITSNQPALSAHVLVAPAADCHEARLRLQDVLAHDYAMTHTTLQVDHVGEELLQLAPPEHRVSHCADPHGPVHRSDAGQRPAERS